MSEKGGKTVKTLVLIFLMLLPATVFGIEKADLVLVVKSESRLYLKRNGKVLKTYHVVFGANPKGHKQQEGDERTPEGRYILDYKKADSAFYKAIHISYPNAADKKRAGEMGVKPGGQIMIHGQKNGWGRLSLITRWFNWTDGCIGLSNPAMDEIWQAVDAGTPIDIQP
ncbi:MAG: L,D-transpeptidase family protein [Desulfobacteraceae bacterium]|nr:L,D-transpeptidase family protein [Desulfobacteraceae bacterium]